MVDLEKEITGIAEDGRIKCAQALGIARKTGIPPKDVGDAINELGIKITSCQLGCF